LDGLDCRAHGCGNHGGLIGTLGCSFGRSSLGGRYWIAFIVGARSATASSSWRFSHG
jgi:hypothetical protein